MASLGLDFSKNLSFFAVPAAFLCALGPHTYTVVAASRSYDNTKPRTLKENIAENPALSDAQKRRFTRAKNASENGFETLGLFAAAVVAANQAGVGPRALNAVAWGYVATRIAFNVIYIDFGETFALSCVRSAFWSASVMTSCGLFIKAGLNMMSAYVF